MDYWIDGRPATFATKSENEWKQRIRNTLGDAVNKGRHIGFEFHFPEEELARYALDIDNLCEPVFSALTTGLRWFDGCRANVSSWSAGKKPSDRPGLLIRDLESEKAVPLVGRSLFHGIYEGPFPNRATDPAIPAWLQTQGFDPDDGQQHLALELRFGSRELSIATINGGKIKPIIDCLYPILGGSKGAPHDHRISTLRVAKGDEALFHDKVNINILQDVRWKEGRY